MTMSATTDPPAAAGAPTARTAAAHERRVLRDVLARAFWDDPVMAWLLPDERDRYARLRSFYAMELAAYARKGEVLTTDDLGVAALWAPPGTWKSTPVELARVAHHGVRAFGRRLGKGMRAMEAFDRVHPAEPHWYLAIIGADPGRRGSGAGRAVIEAVLERCDAAGLPAYLESSKGENLTYYERFGFRVTSEEHLPEGGPRFWPMWRDPR